MACTCPSDFESLLKERGLVVLDSDDVPEQDDTNDLDTFLKYEALLILSLLSQNKSPRATLANQIKKVVSGMDLSAVSPSEQQRIIQGMSIALQEYKSAIVPAQKKLLIERMNIMGSRTQKNVQNGILTSRREIELKFQQDLYSDITKSMEPPVPLLSPLSSAARQTTSWNQQVIQWSAKDTVAMDYLGNSQALYAGKFIDKNLINRARNIITRDYSLYGDSPEKISQLIKDNLVEMVNVTDTYWRTVATNALANARSYANLRAFQETGVHSYVFVAVIDSRTTKICESLNGKVFPVRPALERMESAINAQDLESLDKFTPMVRTIPGDGLTFSAQGQTFGPDVSESWLIANGVTIPPLHFLCRSTIRPN